MRRRIVPAALALWLALVLLPGGAQAAPSGSCGDGLTYSTNGLGTMWISGTGR